MQHLILRRLLVSQVLKRFVLYLCAWWFRCFWNIYRVIDSSTYQSVQVKSKLGEIEEIHSREIHRQERLEKAREELHLAETELLNLPPFEPPRAEIVCLCLNCGYEIEYVKRV